ncbi:hypothetical protein [Undibacterium sp. TJN19]|uniref:hypothetical protein n=1 Tax=Undibacterium sp. TJN19 TaxID=3413055 RepID=UPI003BF10870
MHTPNRNWAMYIAIFSALFLGFFSAFSQAAAPGNEALLGTWQGKLVINPSTSLTIQFIVNRNAQNKLSAVLNAPEEANLQNIAVNAFSLSGDKVSFVVDEVNGKYEGKLKDGKMTGKWKQNGSSFDLGLVPLVKKKIPAETVAYLNGPWNGVLSIPQTERKLNLVINFKADSAADSGMSATIDSPDQSVFGIAVESVSLQDGTLRVKVLRPEMSFAGKVEGNQLVGKWTQGGDAPLTFNKGKFQAAGLVVDKNIRDKLNGNWYGKFSNGIGIALKFKDNKPGNFTASLDSPYEGRKGVPITAISLDADKVSIRIDGVGATFNGTLTQDSINGKFSAEGQDRNLNFSRGEYVPEVAHVPTDLAKKLLGKWEGKTANTYMILRFQLNDKGELIALQDIPNRQLFSLPVSDVTLKGENISLTVKGIAAEFKGKVSEQQISGDWTMPSLQFPLKLSRADK